MLVEHLVRLRFMRRSDMLDILAIERMSFDGPWELQDFAQVMRHRHVIGRVVEVRGVLAGYMVYEMHQSRFKVLNIAVTPELRQQGVGSMMLQHLADSCARHTTRTMIESYVSDGNLGAHKFLAAFGFYATGVYRNYYEDGHDAYRFVFGF